MDGLYLRLIVSDYFFLHNTCTDSCNCNIRSVATSVENACPIIPCGGVLGTV